MISSCGSSKVVEFNEDDKKISLSMKALLDSEDDGAGRPGKEKV